MAWPEASPNPADLRRGPTTGRPEPLRRPDVEPTVEFTQAEAEAIRFAFENLEQRTTTTR